MDDTVGRTYSKETVAFLSIYPFVLCSTAIVRLYCVVLRRMEYTIKNKQKILNSIVSCRESSAPFSIHWNDMPGEGTEFLPLLIHTEHNIGDTLRVFLV